LQDEDKNQVDTVKSIEQVTEGLHRYVFKQLSQLVTIENAAIIAEYIKCQKTEINLSDKYRHTVITCLITFIKYFKGKNFRRLSKFDVINYLDSLRKSEDVDPSHKWMGTYNLRRRIFLKFFKWLYYPTKDATKRPIPGVMRGISSIRRKEQSIYNPDDLWTLEDDHLFLGYCSDKRIRCYHVISRDTSARPSEILKLRVREVNFKLAGDKTYAEISVNGKTGSRIIPLFSSIPFIKDWIDDHPQPGNPNAFLIPSLNRATFGRQMTEPSLGGIYRKYKTKIFPNLLSDENVHIEDKNKIQVLLKKPWNPSTLPSINGRIFPLQPKYYKIFFFLYSCTDHILA
jgi:integrase/recombinase XerD